jgi:hypothetical protein
MLLRTTQLAHWLRWLTHRGDGTDSLLPLSIKEGEGYPPGLVDWFV